MIFTAKTAHNKEYICRPEQMAKTCSRRTCHVRVDRRLFIDQHIYSTETSHTNGLSRLQLHPATQSHNPITNSDRRPIFKMNTQIKVRKLHEEAIIPSYSNPGDAGADLSSIEDAIIPPLSRKLIATGISIELPEGYVGLIHPRSGRAIKDGLSIVNAPGTIDSGYRGEIKVILINTDRNTPITIKKGDRIAQLVIQQYVHGDFTQAASLSDSERSEKGFGSSGK